MLISSVAFLGCVVLCGSYPGFREELQIQVNDEENFDPLIVKKDRDKRNANIPPDNTEKFKPVDGSVDQSVALLAEDQDFLNNLKNVFGENKRTNAPANLAAVFDENMFNYTNENNTGMDDRLQPYHIVMDKFQGYAPTAVAPIAANNNYLVTETKKIKDESLEMQQVFGSPPYHTTHETTSPPMINQTKNEPVENTTDTDYRFTSATILKESYNRMGTGGSSTNIIWFYMYSLSLTVLFVS